jgi:hypothetical protein
MLEKSCACQSYSEALRLALGLSFVAAFNLYRIQPNVAVLARIKGQALMARLVSTLLLVCCLQQEVICA